MFQAVASGNMSEKNPAIGRRQAVPAPAAYCARVLVCRIRAPVSRSVKNGGFLSSRNPEGGHQPQTGRVIPAEQEPDVWGRVCNNRGIFPLHVKPGRYPDGNIRGAVHHAIVLAEENHMQKVFSREYSEYCSRVRRYI